MKSAGVPKEARRGAAWDRRRRRRTRTNTAEMTQIAPTETLQRTQKVQRPRGGDVFTSGAPGGATTPFFMTGFTPNCTDRLRRRVPNRKTQVKSLGLLLEMIARNRQIGPSNGDLSIRAARKSCWISSASSGTFPQAIRLGIFCAAGCSSVKIVNVYL